ncbi:MAG TPA: glycosyltransferase family 39 protein, partial [Candidatus Nitrosocosmicus sp.]|nr:glycosyltransferase family 39 protein [Candidatus Nitrosocosmicus sp.]
MHIIFLFLTSLFLIVLKAGHAGIRLSDTNIYFYTSWLILHGKLLYKDIFFTNLPVFPYISALYVFLLGNLEWYYLTATLEVIIVGLLIYFITKKRFKDKRNVALTCSFLYIFSFITLSTSDHQSGVFLSSILAMASYFFYIEKRYLLLGISLGITLTIKAYLLPIIIAFFLFLAIKESKNMLISLVSFLITIIIVLTPFVILAGPEFKTNILQYSLVRLPGLSKINIILFFIKHDFALFFLIIFNVLNIKRNLLFFLITLFCAVFILLYQ